MLTASPTAAPQNLISKQLQMRAQSDLEQARFYKTTQQFEMALASYDQARVTFKHAENARKAISLSELKGAFSQAQAPQTPEGESLQQRIAEVYVERAEVLTNLGKTEKAQKSYEKAKKWGYEGIHAASTSASMPAVGSAIGLSLSTELFSSKASLTPPSKKAEARLQEKHQWVAQTFEAILKQFQDLDLCQGSPSLFLVYAHNNPLAKADAEVSQRVIQWLSTLRAHLYSDRSASGHQAVPFKATPEDNAQANDILASQLCLLPNHPGTVDHAVLCGSELLGKYMASPYSQRFCKAIEQAYQQASKTHDFAQIEAAVRQVVEAHLNEPEFHHVLTELAFLQIRAAHLKGEHGIIPMLLNSRAEQCLPLFILNSTTIRIEESRWRAPSNWKGQTYQDEGLHVGFFKLLKRLFVKQERCIALVEEKIYQSCLQQLREDKSHTLTAETFSRRLHQACVSVLDALKQEHGADLRELNVQKAYESLRAEIRRINGESLVTPDQLRPALEASYSAKRLAIQRLSGPPMSMAHCYINLAIVEHEKALKEEKKSKAEPDHFRRLPSAEAMHSNAQKLVPLEQLFEPRALSQDKTITPKRILIRGRAGVGKTTLSKKIVYEYTQKGQWKDRFDYVLWIPLRTLKGKPNCDLATLFYETYFQSHPKGQALAKTLATQIEGPAKGKTLFVLDGWDEVAQEWGEQAPMAKFLHQLLNQPAVVITSRPYVDLKQAHPMDLELETVGFSPENVTAYLDNRAVMSAAQAQEMKEFIRTNSFIQGLVNVPIQLDALCYSWDEIKRLQQEARGWVTVTSLYQAMMNKLWRKDMLRLDKREGGTLLTESQVNALERPFRIEKLVSAEQDFLNTLAFRGLQRNQIEFSHRDLHRLIEELDRARGNLPMTLEDNLQKLSFLHTDDAETRQRSYHFMHLTFQEFFAAKHFVQAWESGQAISLWSADVEQWTTAPPEALVYQHKYNPRYEIFWWFVSGLLRGPALNRLVDVLEAEPRDLFGAAHQRLMMSCLHEASRSSEVGLSDDIRDRLEQHLAQWLRFEMDQREAATLAYQPTFPEHLLLDCLKEAASAKTKIVVAKAFEHRSALSDGATQTLIDLTKDANGWVRSSAAEALGQQSSLPESAMLALIELIKDQDSGVRHCAAVALGKLSSLAESALLALIDLTKDQNNGVKRSAAVALGKLSSLPASALLALIDLTKDQHDWVRRSAASVLGKQSSLPASAILALIKLIKDQDYWVRRSAAEALGQQSSLPESALLALIALINDQDNNVRDCAAYALGKQSSLSESAMLALIALIKDQDYWVRRSAAEALGQQSSLPESALLALIALINDQDNDVRDCAAYALGKQSSLSESAMLALIALIKDKSDGVRRSAAEALGQQSSLPESALLALIELTKDQNNGVRRRAAYALGQQSSLPASAMLALIDMTKDQDDGLRYCVALALGQHSSLPKSALLALIDLTKDENNGVRSRAAESLGKRSSLSESAMLALIALIKDRDNDVRRYAAEALGQLSSLPASALLALIDLIKDQDDAVRHRAAESLGKRSSLPESALLALIALIKDQDDAVRRSAAEALGQQSSLPESALLTLINLTKDQDDMVRYCAAEALGKQSSLPESAMLALIVLTKDQDNEVRRCAAVALGQQSSLPESAMLALIDLAKDQDDEVRRRSTEILIRRRWTLYRLLPTLNRQQIALIYTEHLLKQRFDQSVPFYIQDNNLCFYTNEGLQTFSFGDANSKAAFKQAIQQVQQDIGIPLNEETSKQAVQQTQQGADISLPPPKKVGLFRKPLVFLDNKWTK